MDKNGYPERHELIRVETYVVDSLDSYHKYMKYIESMWQYSDCGYWQREGNVYYISTAGWSGNEEIVEYMKHNYMFWSMYWGNTRRGGHYTFIPNTELISDIMGRFDNKKIITELEQKVKVLLKACKTVFDNATWIQTGETPHDGYYEIEWIVFNDVQQAIASVEGLK